mmetsp:Transcript_28998/g.45081  ORF Transcript_28998/g.45081 Transcript_28998/m.45081 type:complete len:474 (+) Transcript_28998:43-1464(+)
MANIIRLDKHHYQPRDQQMQITPRTKNTVEDGHDGSPSSPWTKERIDAVLQQHGLLLVDQQQQQPLPLGNGDVVGTTADVSASRSSGGRNNLTVGKRRAKCTINTAVGTTNFVHGSKQKNQVQSPACTDATETSTRSPFSKPSLSPASTSGGSTSLSSSAVSSARSARRSSTEDIHDMFAAVHDWQQHARQNTKVVAFADENSARDDHVISKSNSKRDVLFSPFSATYMGVFRNDVNIDRDIDNGNSLEECNEFLEKSSLDSYCKRSKSVARDIEDEIKMHSRKGTCLTTTPRLELIDQILEKESQLNDASISCEEIGISNKAGHCTQIVSDSDDLAQPFHCSETQSIRNGQSLSIEIRSLKQRLTVERYENELLRKEEDTLRRKLSKTRIHLLEANEKLSLEKAMNEKLHARLDEILAGNGDRHSDFQEEQETSVQGYDPQKIVNEACQMLGLNDASLLLPFIENLLSEVRQ